VIFGIALAYALLKDKAERKVDDDGQPGGRP
jgi:hypothetical protein